MPIVDESKQNKGVNNNTRNKQMAIDMEYYNRLNHLRFKSPYLGASCNRICCKSSFKTWSRSSYENF